MPVCDISDNLCNLRQEGPPRATGTVLQGQQCLQQCRSIFVKETLHRDIEIALWVERCHVILDLGYISL